MLGGNTLATIAMVVANLANNSQLLQGDLAFETTDNATPAIQLVVDGKFPQDALKFEEDGDVESGSGDILANTYRNQEFCTGFTGALLCQRLVKLTYSGSKPGYNAGSFTCSSSTCALIRTTVMSESGADALYVGWTNTPLTTSGAQIINNKATFNGGLMVATGAHLIPPGATVKAVWAKIHPVNSADASIHFEYLKYHVK
jgi:hypothetical protein